MRAIAERQHIVRAPASAARLFADGEALPHHQYLSDLAKLGLRDIQRVC